MNDSEYLKAIKETYDPHTQNEILYCMVGVAGEAGEIANMVQKAMRGDFDSELLLLAATTWPEDHPFLAKYERQREKLLTEMGGVFYFLHALCWKLGVEPGEVMRMNVEKLLSRKERGVIRGDGDDR